MANRADTQYAQMQACAGCQALYVLAVHPIPMRIAWGTTMSWVARLWKAVNGRDWWRGCPSRPPLLGPSLVRVPEPQDPGSARPARGRVSDMASDPWPAHSAHFLEDGIVLEFPGVRVTVTRRTDDPTPHELHVILPRVELRRDGNRTVEVTLSSITVVDAPRHPLAGPPPAGRPAAAPLPAGRPPGSLLPARAPSSSLRPGGSSQLPGPTPATAPSWSGPALQASPPTGRVPPRC